jgi:NAD(P)-dependent dehydrogenase (short-subunit alcohol dehydrogenase family)
MPSISTVRASNAIVSHLTSPRPVAIFVGGTSGIGEAMARLFACHTEGNSNIVIVGRNKEAANRILSSLPSPTLEEGSGPPVSREFIHCDATLMKNVHTATQEILSKYPKINYLVLSTGLLTLAGRDESSEGIDKKLALHYYSRWKFIHDLAPAMQKAKENGEEGAVMSVLSAGKGGEIDVEDLGLKKSFSLQNAALAAPTYNDLMMEVGDISFVYCLD